jgi:hypothetical protein
MFFLPNDSYINRYLALFSKPQSWVLNEVYFWHSVLMLHILLLMMSIKVLRECLSFDCFNLWFSWLRSFSHCKWFVVLLVHCFKVKALRVVMSQSITINNSIWVTWDWTSLKQVKLKVIAVSWALSSSLLKTNSCSLNCLWMEENRLGTMDVFHDKYHSLHSSN